MKWLVWNHKRTTELGGQTFEAATPSEAAQLWGAWFDDRVEEGHLHVWPVTVRAENGDETIHEVRKVVTVSYQARPSW